MNKVQKTITAVAALGVVAGVSIAFNATKTDAWGDNGGGRQGYTKAQIESGVLGDKVVFNSITDGTIGDERNFVGAREDNGNNGSANVWNGNEITVEDGKTYVVRMYVHNNSPLGYDAIAENVKAAFAISEKSAAENAITGYITSSNATPSQYWDSVVFKSSNGQKFTLDYVEGSALVENNGYAKNGAALSDAIITKSGVALGYDKANDGKIPGCYQYSQFVTIRVKPVFTTDENYVVEKTVRLANGEDKTWKESITAEVGDIVEYQVYYKNTTSYKASNVVVKDSLPVNMAVKTSPILYNSTTGRAGHTLNDFTANAVSIGGYNLNGEAYLRFTAEVVDNSLACGKNTLRNWVRVSAGSKSIDDSADVVVEKTCDVPTPEIKCEDGSDPDENGECPTQEDVPTPERICEDGTPVDENGECQTPTPEVKCEDGSDPDANGECPTPTPEVKCEDGSDPDANGECPTPTPEIKCEDGSDPDANGECPTPTPEVKCEDGSDPNENGECPTPTPEVKCEDGSDPDENGQCPTPTPEIKCEDGSDPDANGQCPTPTPEVKCEDGSDPDENGQCPTPEPEKKCKDGSEPDENGECPTPAEPEKDPEPKTDPEEPKTEPEEPKTEPEEPKTEPETPQEKFVEPTPAKVIPNTGASGIFGASAIIVALGGFITSRRHLG